MIKHQLCYRPSTLQKALTSRTVKRSRQNTNSTGEVSVPTGPVHTKTWPDAWTDCAVILENINIHCYDMITLPCWKQTFNKNMSGSDWYLFQSSATEDVWVWTPHWIFPQTNIHVLPFPPGKAWWVSQSQAGAWGEGNGANNYRYAEYTEKLEHTTAWQQIDQWSICWSTQSSAKSWGDLKFWLEQMKHWALCRTDICINIQIYSFPSLKPTQCWWFVLNFISSPIQIGLR